MNRRTFLAGAATGAAGLGGGYFLGQRDTSSDDDQPPRRESRPAGNTTGTHEAEKQAVTVGDAQAVSTPFVRVVDEIGVLTAIERTPTDPGPEAFETLTATDGHRFVVLYAEAWWTDDDRSGGPPASTWALDVWVPSQHLAPRVVDTPDTVWYRLPDGVEPGVGDRRLPAYPRNAYHGGYLVFEAESPEGTIELLFRPDYDEFELDVPKAAGRWKFEIADA